jgi:phosphatidylglycerophosphatase A
MFSTLFFIGYIPLVPTGTIGSLLTVGALWYFRNDVDYVFQPQQAVYFWFLYILFTAFAIYVSNNAKELFNNDDPREIIIDECAGQLVTFFLLPLSFPVLVLGFFLFRFFDIVKPYPVYTFEEIDGGVGIVMDDVIAGVLANISLTILLWGFYAIRSYL